MFSRPYGMSFFSGKYCIKWSEGISLLLSKQPIFMHFVEGQRSSLDSSFKRNNSAVPCADCALAYGYEFMEN
jgi:hypothetical protein